MRRRTLCRRLTWYNTLIALRDECSANLSHQGSHSLINIRLIISQYLRAPHCSISNYSRFSELVLADSGLFSAPVINLEFSTEPPRSTSRRTVGQVIHFLMDLYCFVRIQTNGLQLTGENLSLVEQSVKQRFMQVLIVQRNTSTYFGSFQIYIVL